MRVRNFEREVRELVDYTLIECHIPIAETETLRRLETLLRALVMRDVRAVQFLEDLASARC